MWRNHSTTEALLRELVDAWLDAVDSRPNLSGQQINRIEAAFEAARSWLDDRAIK